MPQTHRKTVIVVGAGAAGCGAAIAAARTGAEVLLVESASVPGGDLLTGMPILGSYTSRGASCVGGVLDEIVAGCQEVPGGYIGPICDWRTVHGLCLNPAAVALVLLRLLDRYGVKLLLNTTAAGVECADGRVHRVRLLSRDGKQQVVECAYLVDASGDASVVALAAGRRILGGEGNELQPVSLVFRMAGVDVRELLTWIRAHPGNALLAENPVLGKTREEAAQALLDAGHPYVALTSQAGPLQQAIAAGEMFPCAAIFLTPSCLETGELCINATRIAEVNAADPAAASAALLTLSVQVRTLIRFLVGRIPGFGRSCLSAMAPRLGVRETYRVVGEQTLAGEDVLNGVIPTDSIALGSHHVDIHGSGTQQVRIPIRGGGAYGIPFGCLIPVGLGNLLVAGRCLSSDRRANGSARVMGTCLATGHAAGTAVALAAARGLADIRQLPVVDLQGLLREQHGRLAS